MSGRDDNASLWYQGSEGSGFTCSLVGSADHWEFKEVRGKKLKSHVPCWN